MPNAQVLSSGGALVNLERLHAIQSSQAFGYSIYDFR